ncbi:hypothetical protein A2X44_01765 [candidate division CPR3 bacterium GWF2_35_18]|uniref:3-oxoacyl-(Acyl-carrier-protein) reductase n=1 Tax=candidate division CPR3 bacterium GW2011_GWF2_35_18 TaxID=1618350 RepID=A0A0G0ERG0_UNCC3|nr:MAG: 3-oxoacyl-(Acyl-carrier-protein) reductase [candidate division CPR3 bacterium GW2011_GWF2_35_18]OGB62726.1 MAG: hypothetical protein A2X44_01765 [candidate division CPR3 bacterium GWF2_35_18]OGB65752.1 MAG: hypothetical protein A2250_02025 [candidate division CPR3 bacterium RIFOXYA2_FULL_35_13]OGB79044.1 MAG: hypothetical protein A2296_02470 [candidate division CPR3 bacterium RIFOXYB2_FULL_35_8]
MFDLKNRKALVTGGSRGIGKGIAISLAKAGADVVVNYYSKVEEAEAVVSEIKKLGRQSYAVKADVSIREEVVKMVNEMTEKWGEINILINNAGLLGAAPFTEMTEEEWQRVLNVNVNGYFHVAQEVAKQMVAQKKDGRIINIASIASGQIGIGTPMSVHYGTSKGAIVAFSESLAGELAPYGINVNAIAPGLIETDMVAGFTSNKTVLDSFIARTPKKRAGQPEDIGYAAVYLASDEADYVTGTVLYVDGGYLAV